MVYTRRQTRERLSGTRAYNAASGMSESVK